MPKSGEQMIFEIDIEYRKLAHAASGRALQRTESLKVATGKSPTLF